MECSLTIYLTVALALAAMALLLALHEMRMGARERRRLLQENMALHQTNNRLSWDNSMLLIERKCVAMEYGIKMLPWRASAEVARRTSHAH
jgi:cell division protein FtsL